MAARQRQRVPDGRASSVHLPDSQAALGQQPRQRVAPSFIHPLASRETYDDADSMHVQHVRRVHCEGETQDRADGDQQNARSGADHAPSAWQRLRLPARIIEPFHEHAVLWP